MWVVMPTRGMTISICIYCVSTPYARYLYLGLYLDVISMDIAVSSLYLAAPQGALYLAALYPLYLLCVCSVSRYIQWEAVSRCGHGHSVPTLCLHFASSSVSCAVWWVVATPTNNRMWSVNIELILCSYKYSISRLLSTIRTTMVI